MLIACLLCHAGQDLAKDETLALTSATLLLLMPEGYCWITIPSMLTVYLLCHAGEDLLVALADKPFRFPATFTFVVRSFTVLDGIGKGLDPRFDISKIAVAHAKRMLFKATPNMLTLCLLCDAGEDLLVASADKPFRFPATFTFVVRSLTVLDGIGKGLDPRFDISEIAAPYARGLLLEGNPQYAALAKDFKRRVGLQVIACLTQSCTALHSSLALALCKHSVYDTVQSFSCFTISPSTAH